MAVEYKQQAESKTIVKSEQKQNYIIPIIVMMLIVAFAVYLIWRFYPR